MDPIRSKQIDEALNYDRNMNAMVLNLEKKSGQRSCLNNRQCLFRKLMPN